MKSVLKIVIGVMVALGWFTTFNFGLGLINMPDTLAGILGVLIVALLLSTAGVVIYRQIKQRLFPLLLVLFGIVVSGCGTTVNPGYAGVVVYYYGNQRGVQDFAVTTGRVWYNPWTTTVFEYPTFVQTAKWTKDPNEGSPNNEEITFTNADGMSIAADISVSYHLDFAKVPAFYVKFRNDDMKVFTHGFMRNLARDVFDSHGGRYRVDQIMGDNAEFLQAVRADLQERLTPLGVVLDQLGLIGAPRPPQAVIDSINAKVHANQLSLQKENELQQVRADAQKRIADAQGYAQALTIKGEAEAVYNTKVAQSITNNLVAKWQLDKWNGQLPSVTGGVMPFLNIQK